MAEGNLNELLVGKDEAARALIAQRVGQQLCLDDLPEVELRAAEALARHLVADAIERVRSALSDAVRSASHLPRDVALKIAHDVDAVSCPFLRVTEVFTEHDWQQLVLTVSRNARVSVARRSSMSEGLAVTLAELGDSVVAQALVENAAAPMTRPVCDTLIDRFEETTWVLDTLAQRDDLMAETAAKLVTKVSAAMRERLVSSYGVPEQAARLAGEAETMALLSVIRDVPQSQMQTFVTNLQAERKLSYGLLLDALRNGSLDFFEAAISQLTGISVERVRATVDQGSDGALMGLLSHAKIPNGLYAEVWEQMQKIRKP